MNAKQLKYLSTFEEFCADGLTTAEGVDAHFPDLLSLDYNLALEVWDYICTMYEPELEQNVEAGKVLGITVLDMFSKKASARTAKAILDTPSVRKAVYQYAPLPAGGTAFDILLDALVANKTIVAEEYLKCLVKNETIEYGPFMQELLERLFVEILKKNPTKRVEMSRKLATLMLNYIAKIKTDERAMLQQRVRETM